MNYKRKLKKLERLFSYHENFYIILLHSGQAVMNSKAVSERLYSVVKKSLEKNALKLSAKELTASLAYENRIKAFKESEVCAVDDAVTLVIIDKLFEIKDSRGKAAEELLSRGAYTLRELDFSPFEERYRELSSLEEYLVNNDTVYPKCDRATQSRKKEEIVAFAKKHRLSELEAAEILRKRPSKDGVGKLFGIILFSLVYIISVALTLVLILASRSFFIPILLFFPLCESVKLLLEYIARKIYKPRPIPKLELDKIPDSSKTAVIITTLLTEENNEPFERLEKFFLSNRDENLYLGLLLDLADSKTQNAENDEALIAFAESKIAFLNEKYGNFFFTAVRQRTYSKSERKYIGWERKRGAIIDLVGFIKDKSDNFLLLTGVSEELHSVKYIITLDSDTNLFTGAVKIFVGAMLHPDNRPTIKNGRVISGYGVMQPRMAVTLPSASKTRFSLLLCGSGGVDIYSSATFDIYQNLFGEGIFCGKGIFDVDAFYKTIPEAFVEERILSHDLLEGNLLRAAFLSDVVLTDSFPKNPLSYFERNHRWARGDVQALLYAFPASRDARGKKRRNPMTGLGRYKLWDNLRRLLTPIMAYSAIILSLFSSKLYGGAIALLATLYLILPFVFSLFRKNKYIFRQFFSRLLHDSGFAFLNMLYSLSSLANSALVSANAIVCSLFRLTVSKRHLLLWRSAEKSDRKRRASTAYLSNGIFSLLSGGTLLTFATSSALRILGLMWMFFPLVNVILSYEYKKVPKGLSQAKKAVLSKYVLDMWGYFDRFVTEEENHLPPDNYQTHPVKALAHRTSPTNIGMYLLSCLAAFDFGYIGKRELLHRCENTLTTLEKLPKNHGHLYNWYDTKTLEVLGVPFVSTVDSGNLAVSLIALIEGLYELSDELPELLRVITGYERLVESFDFSYLYCKERELFYISRSSDTPSYTSCFDIFMSEARSTSFYAVASGAVPKKHWERLSRVFVGKGQYIGLASWSGTAFEYFMPQLLLPTVPNSITYEALSFAVHMNETKRINRLFGVSESAYYAFDSDMNYQYKAHGIDTLALDSSIGKDAVIAPYASFLMLKSAPNAALANLTAIREVGAYGEFGFCEAIDFGEKAVGKGYAVIQSFMSHHIGMSIIAAANAVFDDIFVSRFMKNKKMASAYELLEEKIPANALLFKGKLTIEKESISKSPISHKSSYNEKLINSEKREGRLPKIALVSNGSSYIKAASNGAVELVSQKMLLTKPALSLIGEEMLTSSLNLVFSMGGKCYSALDGTFSYSGTKIVFSKSVNGVSTKTVLSLHGEKNLFAISFSAVGKFEKINPTLVFEPPLSSEEDFVSHPFYKALSIESFYSEENKILFFKRREHGAQGEAWLALSLSDKAPFEFDTRKDALPFCYSSEDVKALASKKLEKRTGAVISPLAIISTVCHSKLQRASADFIISFGGTKKEAEENIFSLRENNKKSITETLSSSLRPRVRRLYESLGADRPDHKYQELYLSFLTYPVGKSKKLLADEIKERKTDRNLLFKASISTELPIVSISLGEKELGEREKIVKAFIKLHKLISEKGVKSDLVFLCNESDRYNKHTSKKLGKLIALESQNAFIGKKGGIFILDDEALFPSVKAASSYHIRLSSDTSLEEIYYTVTNRAVEKALDIKVCRENDKSPEINIPQGSLRVVGGFFTDLSYTVIKDEVSLPHSFVYSSNHFGTLVTQNSCGFTWLKNSKEARLTSPSNNLSRDITDERIVITDPDGNCYDACALSDSVTYSPECASFSARISGKTVRVKISVDSRLPVKLCTVEGCEELSARYLIKTSLSPSKTLGNACIKYEEGTTLFYKNALSEHLSQHTAFLTSIPSENGRYAFLFGIYPDRHPEVFEFIKKKYQSFDSVTEGMNEYGRSTRGLFSSVKYKLSQKELEVMLNFFVPYQAYTVRMRARTGYYQSSGAYGFRDQLQDSLALLPYDSSITKVQIFRAAAHQYTEGDVQHWWHSFSGDGSPNYGIRTRISDDLLWLPFAVSEYVRVSGDISVLSKKIRYIESQPLGKGENDRYEQPKRSRYKESLYAHCIRAINASLKLSDDGLPLIGAGDWNDSFNRVGILGKGVSIWLARFMQQVFTAFSNVAELIGDKAMSKELLCKASKLGEAVEKRAWDGKWYQRGRFDSGSPLGSASSKECKIDLLPQAFSAIVNRADKRSVMAMESAFSHLYDSEYKLFRLFSPAFKHHGKNAGYVSGYCEGLRENGGQYTHAALWGALGFFSIGDSSRAFKILEYINPAKRCMNPFLAKAYKTEPYALCGDVYYNPEHKGRGGWSLYTGAAAWFSKISLEALIGYREYKDFFTLSPALSDEFEDFSLRLERKGTVYHINARLSDSFSLTLDGKESKELNKKFIFDAKNHIIEINIEKKKNLCYDSF